MMKNKDNFLLEQAYQQILFDEHEKVCTHCGECCKEKIIQEGKIIATNNYCLGYNKEKKICTIYENRFELARTLYNVNCCTIEESIKSKQHPEHCPYVSENYRSIC